MRVGGGLSGIEKGVRGVRRRYGEKEPSLGFKRASQGISDEERLNQGSSPLLAPAPRNSLKATATRSGSSAREKWGRLLKRPKSGLVTAWTSPRPVWCVLPST